MKLTYLFCLKMSDRPFVTYITTFIQIEMKPGDYRIQIHILEAKDIKGKGKAGGGGFLATVIEGENPDPMVEVTTQLYLS